MVSQVDGRTEGEGGLSLITRIPMFRHVDDRGVLQETFSGQFEVKSSKTVISPRKNTWHGFHYQVRNVQSKLVTCVAGHIHFGIVDMRSTGGHVGIAEEGFLQYGKSIFVPKGMAFGYLTITDNCVVNYHCDASHDPGAERCAKLTGTFLLCAEHISEIDANAPSISEAERIPA